ncbi:hypothetical protein CAP47_05235 [Psychroflexus sp. S27]|nr:hypothetical protein CAP47_05235 [Psychroflexus sp. S27]
MKKSKRTSIEVPFIFLDAIPKDREKQSSRPFGIGTSESIPKDRDKGIHEFIPNNSGLTKHGILIPTPELFGAGQNDKT